MDKQRIKGAAQQVEGKAKKALGRATGNAQLQREGLAKDAEGTARKAVGRVKDDLRK